MSDTPNSDLPAPNSTWVLWDGECGLCSRFARWVERHDRHARLHVIPYQDAPAPPMTPALHDACASAVHLVTPSGAIYRAGDAVLAVLGILGWGRAARLLRRRPFIWAIEIGYRWVADHRPFVARLIPGG